MTRALKHLAAQYSRDLTVTQTFRFDVFKAKALSYGLRLLLTMRPGIRAINGEMTMTNIFGLIKNIDCQLSALERQNRGNVAYMKVYGILDNFLTSFGSFVEGIKDDADSIKKVKSEFDYIHKRWFLRSSYINRAFYKPRGYPGDYILLERIYVNKPRGIGIDRIMDRFALNRPGAKSIRMRKFLAIRLLKKAVYKNSFANGRINILDVGAGSGRIARQFLNQLEDKEKIHITLLDHDEDAISFARMKFASCGLRAGYVRENIVNIIRNEPADKLRGQDIILSVGLFDYLSDRLFARGIQSLYELLSGSGTLIIANLSKDYPRRFELEWLTHWHLIYRDGNDMLRIIEDANLENHTVSIVTEPQCGVIFCIVKKI